MISASTNASRSSPGSSLKKSRKPLAALRFGAVFEPAGPVVAVGGCVAVEGGSSLDTIRSPGRALSEHLAESTGELEVPLELDPALEEGPGGRHLAGDHPGEGRDVGPDGHLGVR